MYFVGLTPHTKEAARIFDKAIELQKEGDWAGYGEQIKNLERILKKMAE